MLVDRDSEPRLVLALATALSWSSYLSSQMLLDTMEEDLVRRCP